jgi:hypothetical protein
MPQYIIRNYRRIRRKTEYIILTHARNLIEDFYIDPSVIHSSNRKYTWGMWQNYWIDEVKHMVLPCHYFVEFLDKDWVVYKGLHEVQPSYYIEDMVSAGVIKYQYINSILIVIADDYSINTVDRRMSEHLCDKVITGLLREYSLDFTRVKYIDDCLTENWEENLKYSTLTYKYTPAKYFDFQIIKNNIDKYKKK